MSEWKWFDEEMQWKRPAPMGEGKHSAPGSVGSWIPGSPPLPVWAVDGRIPPAKFIRIWSASETLNDARKEIFWLSAEALEEERLRISSWLEARGYEPLHGLPDRSEILLSEDDLSLLLEEGLLRRAEEEDTREAYDPGKAVMDAQDPSPKQPRSHIQTHEMGGGMRFRAKH
jgi:hypothetical protein